MNIKAKRNLLVNLFLIIIGGAVFISLLKKNIYDMRTFKDPVLGTAEIIGFDTAIIGKPFVKYRFNINNKAYIASHEFSPKSQAEIGDICQIMYSENSPEYSKPLVNEDKTLKILKNGPEIFHLPTLKSASGK